MITKTIQNRLATFNADYRDQSYLIGVSGGIDSMVLVKLMTDLKLKIEVAHVNYGLRNEASNLDEKLVQSWCTNNSIKCHVLRCDPKENPTANIQAWARTVRYDFFEKICLKQGIKTVLVAHHADDQAETVLLNLFRGTGLAGLTGMKAQKFFAGGLTLLRPMLSVNRADILAFAAEKEIEWREDASNEALYYKRSALRHEILPLIQQHFGDGLFDRINQTAKILADVNHAMLDQQKSDVDQLIMETDDGWPTLNIKILADWPESRRRRAIHYFMQENFRSSRRDFSVIAQIDSLRLKSVGKKLRLGDFIIIRERNCLVFLPADFQNKYQSKPQKAKTGINHFGPWIIEVEQEIFEKYPSLMIRCWQSGDRLLSKDKSHHKKVADLLNERKEPVYRKAFVPVLVNQSEVLYLAGGMVATIFSDEF